jgi:hypothetical protein
VAAGGAAFPGFFSALVVFFRIDGGYPLHDLLIVPQVFAALQLKADPRVTNGGRSSA